MAIPANPNDRSLLSSIFISADETAYAQAKEVFALFDLPEPEEDEFYSGNNADRVYLNTHGLCFSFLYRRPNILKSAFALVSGRKDIITAPVFEARKLVADNVLQPILQVDLSPNCCLEIVPGVERVGASMAEVKELAKNLKQAGINFYSPEPEFVGTLRMQHADETTRLIVNRRAIMPLNSRSLEMDSPAAGIQDAVYGPLRAEMTGAFHSASGAQVAQIMQECAQIAALPNRDPAKILHVHWQGAGPHTERRMAIAESANLYQQRLSFAA